MTSYPFLQMDVFARTPCAGNPVAVVLDAHHTLTLEEMQRVASWTNLSETVFLTPKLGGYALRIFTPQEELPFAGHPTIGAAHAALHWNLTPPGDFIQHCGLGEVEISGSLADGVRARVPRPTHLPQALDPDDLARALGAAEVAQPLLFDIGPRWLVTRLPDPDALHALSPNFADLAAFEARHPPTTGTTAYALDAQGTPHVRSFAPLHGIPEDPVCGSGNLCVGEHMRWTGLRSPGDAWVARQGRALGRDGHVHISLAHEHTTLGGHARVIFEGEAHL